MSADLRNPIGVDFVGRVRNAEILHNAILALISPELYWKGHEAVEHLRGGDFLANRHPNIERWNSAFSAWQIISNRVTPAHRDMGAAPMVYDLLTCVGTYTHSVLHVHDLGARFHYTPGNVVALCGKVLLHEVKSWQGGERLCIAHYMRDNVHNRLGVPRPGWPTMDKKYWLLMKEKFRMRHTLQE